MKNFLKTINKCSCARQKNSQYAKEYAMYAIIAEQQDVPALTVLITNGKMLTLFIR